MNEIHAAHRQLPFTVRCEGGLAATQAIAHGTDVAVVVDRFAFTTCVSIAVHRGATVYPYPARDATAKAFSPEHSAMLAGRRGEPGLSLSPAIPQRCW